MDLLIAGFGVGCVYASLALGFAVISYVTGIANFAQGALAMVAAYVLYSTTAAGLPLLIAIGVAVAAGAAGAVMIQYLAVIPLRGEFESHTWLLSIIGMSLALEGLAGYLYGYDQRVAVELPGTGGNVTILGTTVPTLYLWMGALLVVSVLAIELLFWRGHTLGRSLRAVAADDVAAELVGIRSGRIRTAAWCVGGVLAATAGVFIAPLLVLSPNMGHTVGLLAVVAAVVGGIGRIGLAPVVGGLLLGLTLDRAADAAQ